MNIDPLYFTPSEFFKGLRLLFNDMDFKMFREKIFPEKHHTYEYVMSWYQKFGQSPFQFWCNLDPSKQEAFEFLVYECARKEAQREGVVA